MRQRWEESRAVAVALVLANAVPLVGVVFLGWNLHSLLVIYWLESGAVGVESVAKIRRAEGEDDPEDLPSLSLNDTPVASFVGRSNGAIAGFFATHYGGFWVVHGLFVLVFPTMFPMPTASPSAVAGSVVALAAYHVASYRINYVGKSEYERNGPVTLMVEPYRRVFVLHLTIVVGAFAVAWIGAPAGALVVMVLVKTVLDLRGHWREHDRAQRRTPPEAPTA
ncbi:DUF6498-containing protein [Saliphagus sp. LR7]|uniref:DUF6498-containing protein n=1 Tax=Saliphagus sp. LR7 TaxID=2282654 RepID=UPI000DF82636|nr:DUF6498-containing protein [Saliphagus sp. LR7]